MITLSKRLSRVASYMEEGGILADIGSDHAYIPVLALLEKKVPKAYACEVVEGPLQSSIKTIKEHGLEGKVIPVLSDGLTNVPEDITEFIIAGMGAYTILDILKEGREKVLKCRRGILQTNSHAELIREYLSEMHYHIFEEEVVEEDGKYYEIIVFEPANGMKLSAEEIFFGPVNLRRRTDTFIQYYEKVLKTKKGILSGLDTQNPRYDVLLQECRMISAMLLK
ncbi:MAG: SAM-dependent methyltransferase [Erysipelotrichaceae bacterium]|nr:SAM-dependent methyltransferase [Erysipelotrichaceae bacterium]MBQ9986790.1 SAM-dependent methyltransferase [Erysipelotrichales bacterium]